MGREKLPLAAAEGMSTAQGPKRGFGNNRGRLMGLLLRAVPGGMSGPICRALRDVAQDTRGPCKSELPHSSENGLLFTTFCHHDHY